MKEEYIAYSKVSGRMQISIPKDVRKRLDEVKEGDFVVFYEDKNRIYIKKAVLTSAPK